tara:strand:- start:2371 stop:2871 length:501 start_codon:yes stop_codon:yes gene_type:complete
MASIPVTLRVYATSCKFPMCDTPQALDIGVDGDSGEMRIYRISGKHRTLIDAGSVLSMWGRWLPTTWGIRSIVNGSILGLDDESTWSCTVGENSSIHLTTPNYGPPIDISASELGAALLLMGGPTVQSNLSRIQFPEHSLSEEVTRVTRHNHRIHQIAQEVEEIEL